MSSKRTDHQEQNMIYTRRPADMEECHEILMTMACRIPKIHEKENQTPPISPSKFELSGFLPTKYNPPSMILRQLSL